MLVVDQVEETARFRIRKSLEVFFVERPSALHLWLVGVVLQEYLIPVLALIDDIVSVAQLASLWFVLIWNLRALARSVLPF